MAVTQHPLVWDFYRSVEGAQGLGGVAHYYDEMSQSLWLSSGIKTNVANIPEGHWETATIEDTHNIGTPEYDSLVLDHAYNGVLFGVATLGSELVYLRYVYAVDCSDIIASGNLGYSENNSVVQLKANLMNIKEEIFMSDSTVFQPGARVIFKILAGDEQPMDMCDIYLDSVDFNAASNTVPISGRNNVGFKLMQSTFDEEIKKTCKPHEAAQMIATLGGISKLVIETTEEEREFSFRADQTLMSGLEQICDLFPGWKIIELPSGTIVMGYRDFVDSYQGNGYYVFDKGSVFKRKTKKSCDASYTKVRITGKDSEDNDLTPAVVSVNTYNQWGLPTNKTYHEKAPDGLTQEELNEYARSVAEHLQYVGVGEDFTCSFQPQLCIGDVAAVDNGDGTSTALGLITSIKHNFGKSGYITEFSTDSGGIMMEDESGLATYIKKYLNGYNRKQTIKDLIQVASGTSKVGPQPGGTTVKVVSSSNAQTLGGKTYDQIVQDAVNAVPDEIPAYTRADNDKVLKVVGNILMWSEDKTGGGGGGSYVHPNVVNYSYEETTGSTSHSRTYTGVAGNRLLLLVMHRGELTAEPEGWTKLGALVESADSEYTQYASIFTKTCVGEESISYVQTETNRSITCFVEFEGVSNFEILEETRQENVASSSTAINCTRTSTRMAVWITTARYFNNDQYYWNVSDNSIWAISDNHNSYPRLGVFVDNRPTPITFTIGSGLSGRHESGLCIQIVPQ